jgi:glyoxylase-like metal-dependent hydrolase (beta-lactamase superfamily II)
MNIYFLEDGDGVIQFDAGTKGMTKAARAAAEQLGGLKRIVLGHAHADHRGTAPGLDVPVHCHPADVADAESDASITPYMDLSQLPFAPVRWIYPSLLRHWDGGAVKIAGTVSEGDEVAGFRVVHFPGHAPGLIGLWRESDRVALVSDVVYLIDSAVRLGRPLPPGEASVPHPAWAWDHAQAKDSVRKLAALEPAVVAAGHAKPLRGENLREPLERAAEKY